MRAVWFLLIFVGLSTLFGVALVRRAAREPRYAAVQPRQTDSGHTVSEFPATKPTPDERH